MNQLMFKKKNEISKKKKKGFTLVELIIVIAIIAILAAMAIPRFSAVRIDARVSNDVAAAKNIQTAAQTLIASQALDESDLPISLADTNDNVTAISKRVSKITPEAASAYHFVVDVDDGNVIVSVSNGTNTYQLAPEDATDKGNYVTAAQS